MKKIKTNFRNLFLIKGVTHYDVRGYFRELIRQKLIPKNLIFTVVSKSKKNILRGLHFQKKKPQGKLVVVLKGEIVDVALDLRKKSKTYLKAFKSIISEKNNTSIYIPPGFAHGFYTRGKENIILYACTNYRHKKSEDGLLWNDKDLNIKWPCKNPILSKKDKENQSLKDFLKLKNGRS